jgi:DNA repair protein RecO (recombination protein O)
MPVLESEAVVLRSYDLKEADRIIVLFTREFGILRCVAKGIKRLKSRFGSSLEQFNRVKVAIYEKEHRELNSIESVELIESRFGAAADPETLALFSYFAQKLIDFLPPHDADERVYRMLNACIDAVRDGDQRALRAYFDFWLLSLTGYWPDMKKCSNCGNSAHDSLFLTDSLSVYCRTCAKNLRRPTIELNKTLLEQISLAQKSAPGKFLQQLNTESLADFENLISRIIKKTSAVGLA